MFRNYRTNISLIIVLTYLVASLIDRLFLPVGSTTQKTLAVILPALTVLLLIIVSFLGDSSPFTSFRVPRLPGTRGKESQSLMQYLNELKGFLEDIKSSNTRLELEVQRLNALLLQMDKSNRNSQILTTIFGIVASWLVSGAPTPFGL